MNGVFETCRVLDALQKGAYPSAILGCQTLVRASSQGDLVCGSKALAIASVATLTGLIGTEQRCPLSAQGRTEARPPTRPTAPPGGDVKTVLHDWANHMGMLRELEEHDLIATLEYLGTGTVDACAVSRAS